MTSKTILSFLRISVTVLFYLMCLVTFIFLVTSLLNIAGFNIEAPGGKSQFTYEVVGFNTNTSEPAYVYSNDSIVRYQGIVDHYKVQVKPDSVIGIYSFISKLISMSFAIGILLVFMRIFKETKLENPFIYTISRWLRMLAALFIISDVLEIINYFVLNRLLRNSISSPDFELLTVVGGDLITGLIIWVIAEIYQKGLAIQDENALTV
jgi:hypothetical protein